MMHEIKERASGGVKKAAYEGMLEIKGDDYEDHNPESRAVS